MTSVPSSPLALHGGEPCVVDQPDSYAHGPAEIGAEEIAQVTAVLESKNLFRFMRPREESVTAQFEDLFAQKTHVTHALAVNSGTSALISGLVGLGVSTGDEVIVPGYTYIATAAAVLAVGAFPVVAEVDASLTLDPDDIARRVTPRTRAVIPVHMRGTPCRMDRILEVARRHELKVLEDCAQANGASYRGQAVGSIGDAGAFSMQQSKIISAGEGGVITTNDREVFERAACYHDSAYTFWLEKQNQLEIAPFLGQNYRLSEVAGAVALAQLRKRDPILERLRRIKRRLLDAAQDLPGIELQDVPDPDGDAAVSLVFYCADRDRARRFAEALRHEGMRAGTVYDKEVPDRHIYYHWDYVMHQRSPDRNGRPWHDPQVGCQVKYTADMAPRTLDYLGRCVTIPLTQRMSDAHVESCAIALTKVAHALAE